MPRAMTRRKGLKVEGPRSGSETTDEGEKARTEPHRKLLEQGRLPQYLGRWP